LPVALFLHLSGDRPQLRLERIDPLGKARQCVARYVARRPDRGDRADFRLDHPRLAARKDAALHGPHLLLQPLDAPLDRLRPALGDRAGGGAGGKGEGDKQFTHVGSPWVTASKTC